MQIDFLFKHIANLHKFNNNDDKKKPFCNKNFLMTPFDDVKREKKNKIKL